jgi:hypothetical protein
VGRRQYDRWEGQVPDNGPEEVGEALPRLSFRAAWKDYQTRIPPTSIQQIRNLMLAVVAEGRNPARNDTAVDGAARGKPVVCKLDAAAIERVLLQHDTGDDVKATAHSFTKKMRSSYEAVTKLAEVGAHAAGANEGRVGFAHPASKYCLRKPEEGVEKTTDRRGEARSVETYRQHWQTAYADWRSTVLAATKRPNANQWECLDLIHRRCVYEYNEEMRHQVNASPGDDHEEPYFRMVHGLPGAGKSEVLKWARSYFEKVWLWTVGVQFQFLAPLNMMAFLGLADKHSIRLEAFDSRMRRVPP